MMYLGVMGDGSYDGLYNLCGWSETEEGARALCQKHAEVWCEGSTIEWTPSGTGFCVGVPGYYLVKKLVEKSARTDGFFESDEIVKDELNWEGDC